MAKTDEADRNKKELIYYQVDSERITAEPEWRKENTVVGSACFKGEPDENHQVEIGYGTDEKFRNRGYPRTGYWKSAECRASNSHTAIFGGN
jgi:RimJ/RimL family protein N-acetyltransferase